MKLIIHVLAIQWISFTSATQVYDEGAIVLSHAAATDEELDRMDRAASGFAGDDGTPDNRHMGTKGLLGLDRSAVSEGVDGIGTNFEDPGTAGVLPPDSGQPTTPNGCRGRSLDQTSLSSCCNGRWSRRIPTKDAKCCRNNYRVAYNIKIFICIAGRLYKIDILIRRGTTAVCGLRLYNPNTHVCCYDGSRHRVRAKRTNDKCCGTYAFDSSKQICCPGSNRPANIDGFQQPKCCNRRAFDANTQLCCNGRRTRKINGAKCCHNRAFNTATQLCCQDPNGVGIPSIVGRTQGCYYCGNRPLDTTQRMCCYHPSRWVSQLISTGYCCAGRAIRPDTPRRTYICCNGRMQWKRPGGDYRCCGNIAYDCNNFKCENGRILTI